MTEQKANYTLTIKADSGYESTTDGRCTADQYSQAIAALHSESPQRTWAGLTDEEIYEATKDVDTKPLRVIVDLLEAKLKEKNT